MERLEKVTCPLALVGRVSVPPSGAVPVESDTVTLMPAWVTALPLASLTSITGAGLSAAPLAAVPGG
jgi:hypothetical protein